MKHIHRLIFFSLFSESSNLKLSLSFFVEHVANFEDMFLSTERIGYSIMTMCYHVLFDYLSQMKKC